ncbi:hypothetical protein [Devosia sp. 1635]|uniref:hypothetical protein n=1 Tax=Devosia sp. 1635 TaxID=2726066 RepID=UPI00156393A2|nr:hypothetical protein [Devosia sp. 1635]
MKTGLFRPAWVRAAGSLSPHEREANEVVAKQYEPRGSRQMRAIFYGFLLLTGFIAAPILVAIILVLLSGVRI